MSKQGKKTAKKPGAASNPNLVVNNITIKPVNRSTADIDTWRNALRAADRGRRVPLYNLYEDLMIDMTLSDAIDKRIEAITNAELTFTGKDGKPVDVIDTLMDTDEFEEVLTEIMHAKFWGHTVIEFDFTNGLKPYLIPRKHVRADIGEIAKEETDERGTPYRGSDFFLEVGKSNQYGLIFKAAPYVIYKRGSFGDWAQYVEIFGMPFRIGKYNNYDEATRLELIKALEQAGSAAIAVIPKEGDIEYRDNKSSGDGGIYNNLRMACNEEILIGILGQTMTTLNGSSRSQGEVHLEVQENKHKSDRRFVQRVLNHKLLPLLEKRGYPVSGGYFSFPEAGETVTITERVAIIKEVSGMVPVSASYVYEATGIPKPQDGEELVKIPGSSFGGDFGNEPDDPDDPENTLTWVQRLKQMAGFFGYAPRDGALNGNPLTNAIADEEGDDFDTRLIKRVARGQAGYFDPDLFLLFAGQFNQVLQEHFKAGNVVNVGIEYGMQNDAVLTAMETNLFHFSAAKTLAELQQLNQLYRDSKSLADYLAKARQLAGQFNETWAQTEYNTAGLVAESSATYHRLREQTDLFPYWEYRTVGDDKVRETHRKLDGAILPANDPRWKKLYPPNDWNCRCYVVPRMRHEVAGVNFDEMRARVDEYLGTTEYKTSEAQGFGVNRAESNEVFTGNQFYIRKFPHKAAKYLDKLGAADFGLKGVSKYKAEAVQTMPRYTGSPEDWFKARKQGDQALLEDYNGRKLVLPERGFRTHTTGSYKSRAEYLDSLPQTLKDPDEVWINSQRSGQPYDNYTLIKYYRDEVVVVCCRVIGGKVNQVQTWFPLRMDKRVISKHRRGLLIYKKASGEEA